MPAIAFEDLPAVRVLIIDDNPTIHDAFDGILCRKPMDKELEADEIALFGESARSQVAHPAYELDHAQSGQEGVEKVRQAIEGNRPYQLAFVDIRMPGMDGVETIEHIWKVDARIQTVICTAYADYRWEDLAKRFGYTDRLLVLKKPFHDIEVMQLASTLARKWFLGKAAEMKFEQMETLVGQRTQQLLEVYRREEQQIRDLHESKLQCLLRLAQDFRGPLTLILNPLEDGIKGRPLDHAVLERMHRHARELLRLLEDSLLMRRLEPAEQVLELSEINILAFIRGLLQGLASTARQHHVQIRFEAHADQQVIWSDASKLERVLFSLFGRALSIAGRNGTFAVHLRHDADFQIVIDAVHAENKAIAIATPNIAAPLSDEISILLSREMLTLIKGNLKIESLNHGMRMIVSLPEHSQTASGFAQQSLLKTEPVPAEAVPDEKESRLILMIECNGDFRSFMRQGLGDEYRVAESEDLPGALNYAREHVPDLVVIDLDGLSGDAIAFGAELKRDQITSHIPIVMLAGDVSESTQLKALDSGVDDFVAKPFRLPLLKARVGSLLENRRKLHQYFQDLNTVQPREMAANQADAKFLRRVVEIVEKNLADYEFDVETLARQLAVSRRQLFRKFKAVAGCTPNVFIRDIRLKHAAQLLVESQMTVSEIIYAVGFSDPKYFRAVFRERFGTLPGEYGKTPKTGPGDSKIR